MAKKWCGFLPQNDAIRHKWDILVRQQDNDTEVLDMDSRVALKPESAPEEEGEPIPIERRES